MTHGLIPSRYVVVIITQLGFVAALPSTSQNCFDVPFVIVDKLPLRGEKRIDSFVNLKNFYKWDDDTVAYLLGENIPKIGELRCTGYGILPKNVDTDRLRKSFECMDLPMAHKDVIRPGLERMCKENANGKFGLIDTINMTAEEEEDLNQCSEKQSAYFCFALCVKDVLKNDDIMGHKTKVEKGWRVKGW